MPLPTALPPELKTQFGAVKELHSRDLAKKYAGVFLVTALDKKYPNAAKEFVWQWLFPAQDLTRVPEQNSDVCVNKVGYSDTCTMIATIFACAR